MKTSLLRTLVVILLAIPSMLHAQVPQPINYQGRVAVGAL